METRAAEVSKFLDMLRSASVDDSDRSKTSDTDWKVSYLVCTVLSKLCVPGSTFCTLSTSSSLGLVFAFIII